MLVEFCQVVSLHSAARSARARAAPPPPLLPDVLAVVQPAGTRGPPVTSCSRWAAAFTPRFLGRNSCNSPVSLPLKPAAMRGVNFDAVAGLHVRNVNVSGLSRPPPKAAAAAAAASGSLHETSRSTAAMHQGFHSTVTQNGIRNDRVKNGLSGRLQEENAADSEPLLPVTRYLEHFNWTHHVCVVRFPTERDQRASYRGEDGTSRRRETADLHQARGLDVGSQTENKPRFDVETGSVSEDGRKVEGIRQDWLVNYQPNLC